MILKYLWILTIVILVTNNSCSGRRILGLFPYQGKSHYVMFENLMLLLSKRGHEVDVLSHFPLKNPVLRYNDISLVGTLPFFVNNLSMPLAQSLSPYETFEFIIDKCTIEMCEVILQTDTLKKIRDSKVKYDLIVTEIFGGDCMLPFKDVFKAPVLGMISSVTLPWAPDRFGIPDNPSYIPNYLLHFSNKMNLWERIINTIVYGLSKFGYYYKATLPITDISRKFFGENMRSIQELQGDMDFLLVNSHYSLNGARPLPPNVAEVGGLHIKNLEKLPANLEKIFEGVQDGVIYFSLGSMVRTEDFRDDEKQIFIDVFAEFPTYTVLWKADRKYFPEKLPKNIHFENWMPQLEILCHPKTKVFLTHGGLMGTQEAIQCGVPMVGMPLFGDQHLNVKSYVSKNLATYINAKNFTKHNMMEAFKTILDPKNHYTANVNEVSRSFRDRPISAQDTAVFWAEYLMRNKGGSSLKPSSLDLAWYQLYLIDVSLILLGLIMFFITVLCLSVKRVIACIKRNPQEKLKQK